MVAGPNGSGKSTLADALRADADVQLPALYINADELQRSHGIGVAAAQRLAAQQRRRAIAERRDLMYETVMSHPSKIAELQQARAAGYTIAVHFVATDDPAINVERVALRVAAGGHDVPRRKIVARHARTLALAPCALGFADDALIFDNSRRGAAGGLDLQARVVGGHVERLAVAPARWVEALTSEVQTRDAELDGLQRWARSRGATLTQAALHDAATEGVVEDTASIGVRFVVQHDAASMALVVHDAALLHADLRPRCGYRIAYDDGVGTAQALERTPATSRTAKLRAR